MKIFHLTKHRVFQRKFIKEKKFYLMQIIPNKLNL